MRFFYLIAFVCLSPTLAGACGSSESRSCVAGICGCVPNFLSPTVTPEIKKSFSVAKIPFIQIPDEDDMQGLLDGGKKLFTETVDTTEAALDDATEAGKKAVEDSIASGVKATEDAFRSGTKAHRDYLDNLQKTSGDLIDASLAVARFAGREVDGKRRILNQAEARVVDGKVVDAIWHLSIDRTKAESDNAAQLMQENEHVRAASELAVSTYAGPAGAAAFAAWMTYNETGGNLDLAIKAGAYAYVVKSGYASVDAMPTGTAGDVLKKAAVTGALAGAAVAASGGTNDEVLRAFIRRGGAIIVQRGQEYANKEFVDPAKSEVDAYCTDLAGTDCGAAAEWYADAKEKVEQLDDLRNQKFEFSSAQFTVTSDGQWALSWDRKTILSRDDSAPAIVLTYVGGIVTEEQAEPVLAGDAIEAIIGDQVRSIGWIYIGRYHNSQWILPRLQGQNYLQPQELVGKRVTLLQDTHLRRIPFSVADGSTWQCTRSAGPTIVTLAAEVSLNIVSLSQHSKCPSFFWAEVR